MFLLYVTSIIQISLRCPYSSRGCKTIQSIFLTIYMYVFNGRIEFTVIGFIYLCGQLFSYDFCKYIANRTHVILKINSKNSVFEIWQYLFSILDN